MLTYPSVTRNFSQFAATSCPGPTPSKVVLCYYEGHLPLQKLDPCLCSHFIFTSAATINPTNYTLNLKTGKNNIFYKVR